MTKRENQVFPAKSLEYKDLHNRLRQGVDEKKRRNYSDNVYAVLIYITGVLVIAKS